MHRLTPHETGWSISPLPSFRLRHIAKQLAESFVSGVWTEDDFVDRAGRLFGKSYRWLGRLASDVASAFGAKQRPRAEAVRQFLSENSTLNRAYQRLNLKIVNPLGTKAVMRPARAIKEFDGLPSITSLGELAQFLGESANRLDWLADLQNRQARNRLDYLDNYFYAWRPKRNGSARLIESPKPALKRIQRKLLQEILDKVPPHWSSHAYQKGRSIRTFAAKHVGKSVVIKLDLESFFPSIRRPRVAAIFRTIGYPEPVALKLACLCTNAVHKRVWLDRSNPMRDDPTSWPMGSLLREPHLPQGAPTSPAIANLCAYRLDARFSGLAKAVGADYGRYADDLVFSGNRDLARSHKSFCSRVAAIALEEGFRINHRKTRIMKASVRQKVVGVVVNERLNVERADYDALKATLFNCVRFGPESQRRKLDGDLKAHLAGRIAHVGSLNERRGRRLRELFEKIDWNL